jgi:hypothetical protein
MSKYIPFTDENASAKFKQKSAPVKSVINEALLFLKACGVPTEGLTPRSLEMMAMAFLAVADVGSSSEWPLLKTQSDRRSLKTREIITWINTHFQDDISSGSYDDIRRKHLKLPVLAGVIVPTSPNAARNNPQRGYAIADDFGAFARMIPESDYHQLLADRAAANGSLAERLNAARHLEKIPVVTPDGVEIDLTLGKHNELQRAVVEQFLPRFGYGAELLYLGDTADKLLWLQQDKLAALRFFELNHGELPDIIAYSRRKNWLFLIETAHSSGPLSPTRLLQLQTLCRDCTAETVFVTAFLNRVTFRRFSSEIAWETEVWIAAEPDHLIHFNGGKFLGPYQQGGDS